MNKLLEFDVTFQAGEKTPAIAVSGGVAEGSALVVRGPSGAGKSTLLRVLARLHPALSGSVYLEQTEWTSYPGTGWRVRVVYVAQRPVAFAGTVWENLLRPFTLGAVSRRMSPDEAAMRQGAVDLQLPESVLEQDAASLSGGELARMAVLRAALVDPSVLLLDEPAAGLDPGSRQALFTFLRRWLQRTGRAVVAVSHETSSHELLGSFSYLDFKGGDGR